MFSDEERVTLILSIGFALGEAGFQVTPLLVSTAICKCLYPNADIGEMTARVREYFEASSEVLS